MDIISETSKKIKEVKIQGATMISKIIVEALRIYSEQVKAKSVGEFKNIPIFWYINKDLFCFFFL